MYGGFALCSLVDAYAPPEHLLGRLAGDTEYMLDPKVEVFVWGLILADMLGVPRPDTLINGPLEDFVQRMTVPPYQVMVSALCFWEVLISIFASANDEHPFVLQWVGLSTSCPRVFSSHAMLLKFRLRLKWSRVY